MNGLVCSIYRYMYFSNNRTKLQHIRTFDKKGAGEKECQSFKQGRGCSSTLFAPHHINITLKGGWGGGGSKF